MNNAINRDHQTYLLAYWIRSNCNYIMATIDAPYKTSADIKKTYDNVAQLIADALETEFDIEDESVVIEVTNLIYPIDPSLHETQPEENTDNSITLEDLADLHVSIMDADKNLEKIEQSITWLNKDFEAMKDNLEGMRRLYNDLRGKVKKTR